MTGFMGGAAGGMGLGDGMSIPCPNCGTTMLRMSTGATCPECGAFIGGGGAGSGGTLGGIAESLATKEFRGIKASKGKAKAGVYGDWPTTIAKGTRVGFERDGVIVVGIVKEYDVDEETGEVRMTIE